MFSRFVRDRPGQLFLVGLISGGVAGGWAYKHRQSLPFGLGGRVCCKFVFCFHCRGRVLLQALIDPSRI
jgi:hypothetical protein